MGILAQCPTCRTKQKVANKRCRCGEDMDKAKKANRVSTGSPSICRVERTGASLWASASMRHGMPKGSGGGRRGKGGSSTCCLTPRRRLPIWRNGSSTRRRSRTWPLAGMWCGTWSSSTRLLTGSRSHPHPRRAPVLQVCGAQEQQGR